MKTKYKLTVCCLSYFGAVVVIWNLSKSKTLVNNLSETEISQNVEELMPDNWFSLTSNIHLYSAYWDARNKRNPPLVRVIAISLRINTYEEDLQCAFKHNNGVTYVAAIKEVLLEHWYKRHSAVFYLCVPPTTTIPRFVTLVTNSTRGQWLTVRETKRTSTNANIAVCVRPFFGPFNDTLKLAEFLAYYELMGVSRFTFYDFSTTNEIKKYLSRLKETKMNVHLLPWSLSTELDVWERGQLAFTQECIYRHMRDYEFVLILDTDELLVPKGIKTLRRLASGAKADTGCFLFRHSFFCNARKAKKRKFLDLRSENWIQKEDFVWKPSQRSKLMIRTRAVVSSGIHDVHRFAKGFRKVVVNPGEFLLHHYRIEICNRNKKLATDTSVMRFVDVIKASRPIHSWLEMNQKLK